MTANQLMKKYGLPATFIARLLTVTKSAVHSWNLDPSSPSRRHMPDKYIERLVEADQILTELLR